MTVNADSLMLGALCLACALAGGTGLLLWRSRRQTSGLRDRLSAAGTVKDMSPPGLLSREDFEAALDEAVLHSDRQRRPLAVLFVDLDGFGAVNEAIGHSGGDVVLREAAARLQAAVPQRLAAARLGGDEFLLLLDADLDATKAHAQRLLDTLAQPFPVPERVPQLAASIGIALYPTHGARPRIVLQAATAMRSVKHAGGNAWAVFDAQMAVDQRAQAALLADLRQAVDRGQFELFYQPKIDARTMRVTAAEALIRWHHPKHGMVSPAVFIPLAERSGLIADIGNWVITEACRQAGAWRLAGLRMRVAINLSVYQMRQDDLVQRLVGALQHNHLQPDRFTVEITETLALENTAATQHTFAGLRQAGLHVSIDDFGAGQTSLAYLRQLPASELKMDMSLVQDLASSADARAIAEAVIKLAHALERRVVAEGVETQDQRDLLVAMGCDELQGYLFARPMSATALGLWAMGDDTPHGAEFSASLFQDTAAAPTL
jgi:diguanylate cyclase (GGDEF)-like protein